MSAIEPRTAEDRFAEAAPFIFVLAWSTGFVGTRIGVAYAEPFTFLAWRYLFCLALMALIVVLWRAPWPRSARQIGHAAIVGILMHGFYLGGIFWAIGNGMSAGIAALIVGLHPLISGVLAGWALGETVTVRRWGGLALGFAGMTMVVASELGEGAPTLVAVSSCLLAVLGIATGAVWQKRFGSGTNIRASQVIQFAAAGAMMTILSRLFETGEVVWATEFILTMAWLVLVLSVGAVTLFYWLNRRGEVARLASFFYLIAPCTAIQEYLVFGKTLGWVALAGIVVSAAGVAIATRPQ